MKATAILVDAGSLVAGQVIALDETEAHHLRVRRVASQTEVAAFDGAGMVGHGAVNIEARSATLTIRSVDSIAPGPTTILAVGAGDKDRFIALAERCTELGVTTLVPLMTERAQGVESRLRESSLDRARRRAREACKQSQNPWATMVDAACTISDLAGRYPAVRWFFGAVDGAVLPALGNAEIGWIIGPEGGLTIDECSGIEAELRGTPTTLGSSIMRFDTAATAAAALTHDRRRPLGRD